MTHRFSTTGRNRRYSIISTVLAAIPLLSTVPTPANAQGPSFAVVPPNTTPFGMTYGEWSARWWQWAFALPFNLGPFNWQNETPPDCSTGQFGPVWFLVGINPAAGSPGSADNPLTCHIPAGKVLFFPVINNECSDLEGDPYHGDTAQERKQCARDDTDSNPPVQLEASVDSHNISNLTSYRAPSPDFFFVVPPPSKRLGGNLLGLPHAAVGRSSSDGYYLMVALSPGEHRIKFAGEIRNGRLQDGLFKIDTTYKVIVDR